VNFDSTPSHKILALHYLETRTAIEAPHFQYYYGILLDELGMVYSIRRIALLSDGEFGDDYYAETATPDQLNE
jgi:hypothetical protein